MPCRGVRRPITPRPHSRNRGCFRAPGGRSLSHDFFSHGFPGRPRPRSPIPDRRGKHPPAGDGISPAEGPPVGDVFGGVLFLGACFPVCCHMPPIVFNGSALDVAFLGASAPLSSRRGGRYPTSRQQPLRLRCPGPCCGVYCPASAGRSIAGPPAPPAGALRPFPSSLPATEHTSPVHLNMLARALALSHYSLKI